MTKPLLGKEINALKDIADTSELGLVDKGRFVKFAIAWYNFNGKKLWADLSYALEWGRRFRKKTEYYYSDNDRMALLAKVDGLTCAQNRLYKQILGNSCHPDDKAFAERKTREYLRGE